ncbi:unnamed protein product [Phytophthora lilii]|uniref:Unnamed protein product n=1 Tax=Phytophthora lilii TaxID=2077276 RepID=A0A9W6WN08_9STRA|nr:unnamed protein product [Phytophthora lilii]
MRKPLCYRVDCLHGGSMDGWRDDSTEVGQRHLPENHVEQRGAYPVEHLQQLESCERNTEPSVGLQQRQRMPHSITHALGATVLSAGSGGRNAAAAGASWPRFAAAAPAPPRRSRSPVDSANATSAPSRRPQPLGASPPDAISRMEDELIAQRDAAIAVTKELQRQLQSHREAVERTFERRTLTAERLRLHAEEKLRRAREDRDWAESCCRRLLALALFLGCGGAVLGWALGLLALLALGEPLAGFLLVLPGMALGTLLGLALAKTQIQLESRRRDARARDATRHSEVEMAVSSGVGEHDAPLEPLPGMEDVARQTQQDRARPDTPEKEAATGPTSLLAMGWSAAWFTLQTSKAIAVGLYHGGDYVRGVLHPQEDSKKNQ